MLDQYDAQKSRGQQGFGVFDGEYMNMIKASQEDNILKWLVKYDSNLLLFHHRFPTSTINVKRAAHPFSTGDYFGNTQYVMVHNGHVSNSDELWDKHTEMGIRYKSLLEDYSFNDSEALAWDLALTLEGKQDKLTAYGSIAFVCLKLVDGKLDKLYFGRNSSPLNMKRDKSGVMLSSEGEGEAIQPYRLYTFNYELKRLTNKYFSIPSWSSTPAVESYKGYDDSDYNRDYSNWTRDYFKGNNKTQYEQDPDTQMYLPVYEDDDELEFLNPDIGNGEVQSVVMNYLDVANGLYDDAYYLIEDDYADLVSFDDSEFNRREAQILIQAMAWLDAEPEYIDNKSVSSQWRAICSS